MMGDDIDKAIRDQSYQSESEEGLNKLRAISDRLIEPELATEIVENAQRAIIIARKDGTIFYANKLAETFFEYPRSELWDKPLDILIPDRLRDEHIEKFNRYLKAPRVRDFTDALETIGRKKSGTEVALAIALLPVVIPAGFFIVASIEPKL